MFEGLGYLRVRFYLLEYFFLVWLVRVLGYRYEEYCLFGYGGIGWSLGLIKVLVLEEFETSYS